MEAQDLYKKCKEKEFHCYGTTRIFEKKAKRLKSGRTWITFLGIVTPILVGTAVLSFGAQNKFIPLAIAIAGLVGMVQLVLSTWSVVARWDETYEYSIESVRENTELFNRFKELSEKHGVNIEKDFKLINDKYERREFKDLGQSISEKEKRFANRESLKYYQKKCSICDQIPKTSKPSKCDGCGKF